MMNMEDDQPLLTSEDILEDEHEETGIIETFVRPASAEFLATAIFVFIGTTATSSEELSGQGVTNLTGIAIAHGLTIAMLVMSFGHISGAHINPAVTFGFILVKGIPLVKGIVYVFAQLVGSIVGSAMTRGLLGYASPNMHTNKTIFEDISGGGHQLGPGVSVGEGVLGEIALTFILVLVILMTAYDSNGSNLLHPLAIGFAVCVDIIAGAKVTGASMNPARSFGPAVILSEFNTSLWKDHWIYWLGPALGAALAALFYRLIFAKRSQRVFKKIN
nr:aquaporin C [Alitta succinea]